MGRHGSAPSGAVRTLLTGRSKPEVIVETGTGRVISVLAGRPDDPRYMQSMLRAADAILKAREAAEFTREECNHRRADDSAALNST